MGEEIIYVIGHKNPDTDSICSALAYARLRRRQGLESVQAVRAGNLNRQTEFVLEELGEDPPPLVLDVHPRVRDVVSDRVFTITGDAPLALALEMFHRHNIRLLPVVDADQKPIGILVLKRLAERFLVPSPAEAARRLLTSSSSIARCLQARILHLVEGEAVEEFELYVGAMAAESFQLKLTGIEPRRTVVVTGDRVEIQRLALEMGVRVLIVTGALPVAGEIVDLARSRGVTLLSTPFDTATSTWLARLSTPVRCVMTPEFLAVGRQEQVGDLRLKLLHSADPGALVLDEGGRVVAVATKSNLLKPSPLKLVLVDHNELSQAVSGADRVEIIEVVDHHRLGNFHTDQPIRFINQPVGSTCTLVASLYRQAGMTPDGNTAGLMLAGLLSDTVILRSPTTTDLDRELAEWLGRLCCRDPQEFGRRIFAAGSALAAYPSVSALLTADFKEYAADGRSFGVAQVEVVNFQEFEAMKQEIAAGLDSLKKERRLDLAGLLVTDIVQETSLLLVTGAKDLLYLLGYPQLEENLFELKGVLSRKKQLVPHLLKVLKTST